MCIYLIFGSNIILKKIFTRITKKQGNCILEEIISIPASIERNARRTRKKKEKGNRRINPKILYIYIHGTIISIPKPSTVDKLKEQEAQGTTRETLERNTTRRREGSGEETGEQERERERERTGPEWTLGPLFAYD